MAEAKFSGVGVVNMNGSIGNMTFARNFYGTYAKTRIGAPAGSSFLTAWNMEVASLTSIWELGMSDPDRQLWYTVSRTHIDSMADRNNITGFQLFMSVNLNIFLIGGIQTNVPPTSFTRPQIMPPFFSINSTVGISLGIQQATPVPCAVYMSWLLPPGRMSNNQIYAFLGTFTLSSTAQPIYGAISTRVGLQTAGFKRFVKVVPIDVFSGLRGVPEFTSGIIT